MRTQKCIALGKCRRVQQEKAWIQHSFTFLWRWPGTLRGPLEGGGLCEKKVGAAGSTLTPMPHTTLGVSARDVAGWHCTGTLRGIWPKGSRLPVRRIEEQLSNVPSPDWTFSADTQAVWGREIIFFAPWISFLRREWVRLCGPSPHMSLWNPLKRAYADLQKLKPELLSSLWL